jgi:hypothetical protein
MGISHAELLRLLPGAIAHRPYRLCGRTVLIEDGASRIELRLSAERERQLGALRLPATTLTLLFCGHSEDAVGRFMQHFERHLQRGGG